MLLHIMALADTSIPLHIDNSVLYYALYFTYLWFDSKVLNIDAFFVSVPSWVEIAIYALYAYVFVGGVYAVLNGCWSIVIV
jgi:hypothetical protein